MKSNSHYTNFSGLECLVTGGAGFIGSHLTRRLLRSGARVRVIDSLIPEYGGNMANLSDVIGEISFHRLDVRDKLSVQRILEPVDVIFNLAGQTSHVDSMSDPWTDLDINVRAQLELLDSVREVNRKIRIVFASTRQIYGRPDYLPVDEKHPIRPVDVNGINKTAGENYHTLYGKLYDIDVSILRLTNTYGPGMRVKDARQTFLGTWIKSAVEGEVFKVFGDGSQKRDFNYVDDVVDAFLFAASNDAAIGKAMNLGSNEVVQLIDVARVITKLAPSSRYELVPFPPERLAIDIGDYFSDWKLAQEVLQWEPQVALEEGLARTLDFFHQFKGSFW